MVSSKDIPDFEDKVEKVRSLMEKVDPPYDIHWLNQASGIHDYDVCLMAFYKIMNEDMGVTQ